jgi:hypothetical protein
VAIAAGTPVCFAASAAPSRSAISSARCFTAGSAGCWPRLTPRPLGSAHASAASAQARTAAGRGRGCGDHVTVRAEDALKLAHRGNVAVAGLAQPAVRALELGHGYAASGGSGGHPASGVRDGASARSASRSSRRWHRRHRSTRLALIADVQPRPSTPGQPVIRGGPNVAAGVARSVMADHLARAGGYPGGCRFSPGPGIPLVLRPGGAGANRLQTAARPAAGPTPAPSGPARSFCSNGRRCLWTSSPARPHHVRDR